jgi:LPS export ABC transporter permease LptG
MIKKVDVYLITTFLGYFFLSLLVVCALFLFIDVVSTLSRFDVSGGVFLAYYFNYLPWMITQMQPIAGVLATVFLFVTLQKNHELIIFYSLGLSINRVLAPILSVIMGLALFSWFMTDWVVPQTMEKRNYYYYVEMKNQPGNYNKLRKSNVWFRTPEAIINFGKVVSQGEVENIRVFIFDRERWRPNEVIEAKSSLLKEDKWIYKDVRITNYSEKTAVTRNLKEYETAPLEDLKEFKKRQSQLNSMSLSQLSYAIKKAKEASMSTLKLRTEYHGKLSFIFSALFLSLLVLPFCIGNQRSSNVFIGLSVAMVAVMGYWIFYSTMLNFGSSGVLPPLIAAWAPGFISTLSFILFMRGRTA